MKNRIEKSSTVLANREALFKDDASFVGENDCITSDVENQAFVSESFSECSEIVKSFVPKRESLLKLSASYNRIGLESKSLRVSDCGSFLEFAHEISESGDVSDKGKLHKANFCRDRLCPMCSWRRSYKIFGQVSQIMELISSNYKFLFLTLTIPNVSADKLSDSLDGLFLSWRRYIHYKPIETVVKGYFRALEITRNKSDGTYHPHFHCVLAVPCDYGHNVYVQRDEWLQLWRRACKDDSITQVDIRVARDKYSSSELKASSSLGSAVAEIAKYAVKSSDYIIDGDEDLTDKIVQTLSVALHGRRLVSFGGVFKESFKKLDLEDVESDSADLTHINETLNPSLAWLICRYGWSVGAYELISQRIETPEERASRAK